MRQNGKPATAKDSLLPAGLFLQAPPANAVGISEARKTAEEGKPIVMRGRIGGTAKPIAEKYAMFLITDVSIGLCKDGCADFCQVPREQHYVQYGDGPGGGQFRAATEGSHRRNRRIEASGRGGREGDRRERDNNFLVVNAQKSCGAQCEKLYEEESGKNFL